jgi:Spy/CpxP family protein refolding chaperone
MKLAYKLSLLALTVGLLVSIPLSKAQDASKAPPPDAQGPGGPGGHHGKGGKGPGGPRQMIDMLTKKLNLTPDQVTEVSEIVKSHDAAMKALRDNQGLSKEDRRTQTQAIFKDIQTQVRAKLTSDQQAILDKMPPLGPPQHGKKKGGNPPPPSN